VLVATLLAVQYGQAPQWYLLVALARYLYRAGLWLWRSGGNPVVDLQPSARRRALAGVQMGFLAVLLLPAFSPPGTHLAAVLFALPFLASFAHVGSPQPGCSGKAGRDPPKTHNPLGAVILRLAGCLMAGPLCPLPGRNCPGGLLSNRGMTSPESGVLVLGLLEAAVLALLLLGAAGRIAAILALCLLGINQLYAGLTPVQYTLAALYTAITLPGYRPLSLWVPEDRWIHYRGGKACPPEPDPP
jgi:CDP-diacylglycerol--glycerol-3-phosphate 3-phosphatidyltransferase